MGIKSLIQDIETNRIARVVNNTEGYLNTSMETHALAVASRPLKRFDNKLKFFVSDTFGSNMNVSAEFTGTPDEVHDGGDSALWTGTQVAGGADVDFNSTGQAYEGTHSVYFNKLEVDDIAQFTKGSDINLNNYVAVTLWIYVESNWVFGDSFELYFYDTDAGLVVGNVVHLEDYFDYTNYGVWTEVTIQLTDLGASTATTADALRIRCDATSGKQPKFYIDQIQIEETQASAEFFLRPAQGTWYHVDNFTFSFVNNITTGIAYDTLLGETLTAGIFYKRLVDGKIRESVNITNILELLQLPGTRIECNEKDGTNTILTISMKHNAPLVLKEHDGDYLSFTVNDDLSGLLYFRISAGIRVEYRE